MENLITHLQQFHPRVLTNGQELNRAINSYLAENSQIALSWINLEALCEIKFDSGSLFGACLPSRVASSSKAATRKANATAASGKIGHCALALQCAVCRCKYHCQVVACWVDFVYILVWYSLVFSELSSLLSAWSCSNILFYKASIVQYTLRSGVYFLFVFFQ